MRLGILVLLCTVSYHAVYSCNGCMEATTDNPASDSTTKAPPNRFNVAGWETDDNGNVYVGDDNAKLYLISVGSYWPFPKDYRRKRSLRLDDILFNYKHKEV